MAKSTIRIAWNSLWPFASQRYCLRTSLTPEQCWEQLKIHVAPEPGGRSSDLEVDNVVGWFHPPGFTIRRADGIRVTPCPTVASGSLTRIAGGTRVKVRVATAELGLIAITAWLLAWFLFMFVIPGTLLFRLLFGAAGWLVYGMFILSGRLGRSDGWMLVRFLCEILKADEEAQ